MSGRDDTAEGKASGAGPREFSFVDAHGIEIFAYAWEPAEPAAAVVQISHGVGEYAGRYDRFARALTAAGFAVYADDHRGHGKTGMTQWAGDTAKLGKLGPGGLRAAEAAVSQLTALIRQEHPGVPVIMFGHSWGSLMAQRIVNRAPHEYDGLILSGTALRTPRGMESGELNARWAAEGATGYEWLSRDPEVAAAFTRDPLCFDADILKLFGVADALRLYGLPKRGVSPSMPLFLVSGADDPLHRGEANLQTLVDAYRKIGVRDVRVKVYPEARHELLNELNHEAVVRDLITWLLERFGPE